MIDNLSREEAEIEAARKYKSQLPFQILDQAGLLEHFERNCARIRAEAKAEALREAAEMADEAIVRWADPIYVGDMPAEVSELRHKVEYSITHADEPNKEE